MEDDNNVDTPLSSPQISLQVSEIVCLTVKQTVTEMEVLCIGNVLSNIANISCIYKESQLTLIPLMGVNINK